jgi:hypothetical protein
MINDLKNNIPTPKEQRLQDRINKFERLVKKKLRNPDEIHEREYYFDEGYGVSLDEHVAFLKEKMPNIKVEMRRDRDGFVILKESFTKQYKYKIDDVIKIQGAEDSQLN